MNRSTPISTPFVLASTALLAALLAACSGNSGSEDTVTVNGDVPIAYVKRATSVGLNPTDGANFAAGGDLMLREKSSPSATEHNLTARFTQGLGDASDPEVSYDGKKVVFSMRCPSSNTATIEGVAACTGRWNIWEYTLGTNGLQNGSFKRLTASTGADDVDPVYLPGNRGIVFSSNRQAKSSLNQALGRAYFAADEYERERVMNLHTMAADGSGITQISFNMSHERNPVIRPDGDIMFSRWEHVADRNRFAIFRSKPDGTDMFVLYGAQSRGNSYLHPRDMDPRGKYPGQLVSTLMPLSGTQEGGSIMMVDAARYSEYNTPASSSVPAQGGQKQARTPGPHNGNREVPGAGEGGGGQRITSTTVLSPRGGVRLRLVPAWRTVGLPRASRKGCIPPWSQFAGALPPRRYCTGITRRGLSSRTTAAASSPVYTLAPPPTPITNTSGRPRSTLSEGLMAPAVPPRWAKSSPPCRQRQTVDRPKRLPSTRSWGTPTPSIWRPATL